MSAPVRYEMYKRGDRWVVALVADGMFTPVGQHRAKFKAQAQLDRLNQPTTTTQMENNHDLDH